MKDLINGCPENLTIYRYVAVQRVSKMKVRTVIGYANQDKYFV